MTTFPQPFIYTTPISIINRVGISLTNHKISVMGGAFIKNYVDSLFCGKNNVFQHRKEILKLNQSII